MVLATTLFRSRYSWMFRWRDFRSPEIKRSYSLHSNMTKLLTHLIFKTLYHVFWNHTNFTFSLCNQSIVSKSDKFGQLPVGGPRGRDDVFDWICCRQFAPYWAPNWAGGELSPRPTPCMKPPPLASVSVVSPSSVLSLVRYLQSLNTVEVKISTQMSETFTF